MDSVKYDSSHEELIDKKGKNLLARISSKDNKIVIQNALDFSIKMHEGQKRKSGLPYVSHCIDVANILLDWNMDYTTIISALLHDLVEDTNVSLEDIDKVLSIEPRHFGALSGQARIFIKLQKYEKAIKSIERALEFYPSFKSRELIPEIERLIKEDSI